MLVIQSNLNTHWFYLIFIKMGIIESTPLLCKYMVQILTNNKTIHPLAKPG